MSEVPGKLKSLVSQGFKVVFITNQAGIAKGKLKQEDFQGGDNQNQHCFCFCLFFVFVFVIVFVLVFVFVFNENETEYHYFRLGFIHKRALLTSVNYLFTILLLFNIFFLICIYLNCWLDLNKVGVMKSLTTFYPLPMLIAYLYWWAWNTKFFFFFMFLNFHAFLDKNMLLFVIEHFTLNLIISLSCSLVPGESWEDHFQTRSSCPGIRS